MLAGALRPQEVRKRCPAGVLGLRKRPTWRRMPLEGTGSLSCTHWALYVHADTGVLETPGALRPEDLGGRR